MSPDCNEKIYFQQEILIIDRGMLNSANFGRFAMLNQAHPRGVLDLLNFVPIHGVNTSIVMLRGVSD